MDFEVDGDWEWWRIDNGAADDDVDVDDEDEDEDG
jgi:hypothetical protein